MEWKTMLKNLLGKHTGAHNRNELNGFKALSKFCAERNYIKMSILLISAP